MGTAAFARRTRGLGTPRRTQVQRAARTQIAWGHRNPPWPEAVNRPAQGALQSRCKRGDPDASLSAFVDGGTAPAGPHACACPRASSDASRSPVAALPVALAGCSPPRSRSARGHRGYRPAPACRSAHIKSGAAQTARRTAGSALCLLACDGYDSLPRGGPWVVPGRLRATRAVLTTVRVAASFLASSTTTAYDDAAGGRARPLSLPRFRPTP